MLVAISAGAEGQEVTPSTGEPVMTEGAPVSYSGGGGFYSQSLGSHLRVRWNTESYGQENGNFSLGTMKLFDYGSTATFIDGQITMNDDSGVGFNLGGGHRWLNEPLFPLIDNEPMRLMGLSLWADGSTIGGDDFFPQLGISMEALGETSDWRANIYVPLGTSKQNGDVVSTGETVFIGNSLANGTTTTVHNSLTVSELEYARRLGNREAWAFAGAYALSSDDFNAEGFKLGVRGQALPDLFLQFAITDDDLFDTNAVFSIAWHIGRTRSDYSATCTLADRLREPVLRNDYVAIYESQRSGGDPILDADSNAIRVVHVDSAAAAGGDGTVENPLNSLNDIRDNSQQGDIVLVHADSVFDDTPAANTSAVLRRNQRFLGEGNSVTHQVTTSTGVIDLPESSTGASSGAVPMINPTGATTSITLADANEVNNFAITGGVVGIDGTTAAGDPTIRNVDISDTTGDAIALVSYARPDPTDTDNDTRTTEVAFNVTIDNVNLANIGGTGISLDADSGATLTDPLVDLNEAIVITNVDITGGTGVGISAINTNTGGTMTVDSYTYDGGATGAGGVAMTDSEGSTQFTNTTLAGGNAIAMTNVSNVLFSSTTVTSATGNAVTATHTSADDFSLNLNGLTITAATLDGIEANANGSGRFNLTVDNSTINENFVLTAGGTGVVALDFQDTTLDTGDDELAFDVDLNTYSSGEIDIQRNNITTGDNIAFRFNADNPAANTVNFRIADNVFTNNSAASQTADIDAGGLTALNSTVLDNDFNNNGAGTQFTMDSNGAGTTIRLSLLQNTANMAAGTYTLEENAGDFRLFDAVDTFADLNNDGDVTSSNEFNFTDDPGSIPTPTP